jgi:hypothetical protein
MASQNGGVPKCTAFPSKKKTSWADDHVAIDGIMGIGRVKENSLCGGSGSAFWNQEWEYPRIGIYFGTCPSGGHDMIALDYKKCGVRGEPQVVHVDQELDNKKTVLAPTFEAFVKGLVSADTFEV